MPLNLRSRSLTVGATASATAATLVLLLTVLVDAAARGKSDTLREALTQWDAQWMMRIAEHGYAGFTYGAEGDPTLWQSTAFFPGYPILVRIVSSPLAVFGVEDATMIAAFAVTAVGCIALAWGVGALAVEIWDRLTGLPPRLGVDVGLSVVAATVAFGAPMSVVYQMPYTESVFNAFAVWAIIAVVRERYTWAGVLVLCAGLTRLTASALIVMLFVVGAVELWRWQRSRSEPVPRHFPGAAVLAPFVGSIGIIAYLGWASAQTAAAGGYFAIQDRGWGSGWDWGVSTVEWIGDHALGGLDDPTATGYAISAWAMIGAVVLCAATVWSTIRGRLPWQLWVAAAGTAAVALGSGGIMHSRPRLLLLSMSLLMLALLVDILAAAAQTSSPRRQQVLVGTTAAAAIGWVAVGYWISVTMLVPFQYGI